MNDLISKTALLEFAHNHIDGMIDCNDIARFPTIKDCSPRWISVHDALPGMDERVLFIPACNPGSVYIGKLKYVGEVNAVYFVVNNWRRTVTYSATHWMPLPELPKEGKAE